MSYNYGVVLFVFILSCFRPIIYLIQQHHETLQELTIDGAEITDNCYKQIATCTNLISLQSSFCEMLSDNSLIYLQVGAVNNSPVPVIKFLSINLMYFHFLCDVPFINKDRYVGY